MIEYLDELNNLKILNNTFLTQPISRQQVAEILISIDRDRLNQRQKDELQFYLQVFSKDLKRDTLRPQGGFKISSPFGGLKRLKQPDMVYWKSGQTSLTLNPIAGMAYMSNENGVNWQRRIGGDFQVNVGRIGIYGNVRDVYELKPIAFDSMATPKEGALYKRNPDGSAEFSESRGGVTYSFNGGYVGLIRDHVRWGYGHYGSNILDINTVPFAQLKLHLSPTEWFKFDYLHGSLQSDVMDSSTISNVNGVTTFDYHNKYIVSNMFSLRPWKPLWVSFGNSIIYSKRNPEPTFFVPVMFYKSADHYLNGRKNNAGGNAQMFAAISFRPFKKVHLYSTGFVDEISLRRAMDPDLHSNWFSVKSGMRLSNLLPNMIITLEHLRTNAMVYKHYIETTDYTNAGYNMGHYLRDNAREIIAGIDFKPLWWLQLHGRYTFAEKAKDYVDDRTIKDPATGILEVRGIDFLANNVWMQSIYTFRITANPIYRLCFSAQVDRINRQKSNASYEAHYLRGQNTTFTFGMHYGF